MELLHASLNPLKYGLCLYHVNHVVCDQLFWILGGLKNLKVYAPISEFEEIDITKALITPGRLNYPKVAKKSKLDDFLARRTHLKVIEERTLTSKASIKLKYFVCLLKSW